MIYNIYIHILIYLYIYICLSIYLPIWLLRTFCRLIWNKLEKVNATKTTKKERESNTLTSQQIHTKEIINAYWKFPIYKQPFLTTKQFKKSFLISIIKQIFLN